MKKALIILLCIALLSGGGYFGYRKYQNNKDETTVVDVVPVKMMAQPAEYFMYNNSSMSGNIRAANAQKVYVDTNKLVQTVCVKQGDTVKKGDTILEYDMTVVELDLAQKENQVALIQQNIKMANKELQELRNYKPAEDAPQQPAEPEYPEYPEYPEFPEEPTEPLLLCYELGAGFTPASGNGSPEEPFVLNCSMAAVVRKAFMMQLASSHLNAELRVYSDDEQFLCKWILSGEQIKPMETDDWAITDGLTIDPYTGEVSIKSGEVLHGQLSFTPPQTTTPDDMDDWDFGDFDIPDYTQPDFGDSGNGGNGMDYVYTKTELARMIAEKQSTIKSMEIDLRAAELALENARKQKSDGKVVAAVDGIVKKIGKAAGEEETESEEGIWDDGSGDDDNAFAIIEGEGGVEVAFRASELNLPKYPAGTKVQVMSWMTGGSTEATVTMVEETPVSYTVENWGDSPNNSTYMVHAKLDNSDDFTVGNWVQVSPAESSNNAEKKNSVFMPIHYVRQEGGDYYIMKADENDRLTKQYVRAGQILWGYYIEITGGLDMKDRICFPYGQNVKEGVRTNDSTEVLYPN